MKSRNPILRAPTGVAVRKQINHVHKTLNARSSSLVNMANDG